jgi:hypothetical protein
VEKALGPLCAVALGTGALLVPCLAAAGLHGGQRLDAEVALADPFPERIHIEVRLEGDHHRKV